MPDSDWVLVWDFVGVIKTANYKLRQSWVGLVAYVCNPSAQDTEVGGLLRVPGVFDPVLKKTKLQPRGPEITVASWVND